MGEGLAVHVVVPCHDEAHRLPPDPLIELAGRPGVAVLFVDDGSTDSTAACLDALAAHPSIGVLTLADHHGKAEAVRQGIRAVRRGPARWIAYLDADLSTPPSELLRLLDVAERRPGTDVVIGSRVALLGRTISRSPLRHATGRLFATVAGRLLHPLLGASVYDTQCGAKLLRGGPALDAAVIRPFRSPWAFDVELLGRLALAGVPPAGFWEEPLLEWRDRPGSHRSVASSVRATLALAGIARELRTRSTPPAPGAGTTP